MHDRTSNLSSGFFNSYFNLVLITISIMKVKYRTHSVDDNYLCYLSLQLETKLIMNNPTSHNNNITDKIAKKELNACLLALYHII